MYIINAKNSSGYVWALLHVFETKELAQLWIDIHHVDAYSYEIVWCDYFTTEAQVLAYRP